jgi:hypothetical protein
MKFTGEATAAVITAESARSRDMTIPGRRVFTSRTQRLFGQWRQTQLFGPDPARRGVRFRYHEFCDRVSPAAPRCIISLIPDFSRVVLEACHFCAPKDRGYGGAGGHGRMRHPFARHL